MRGLWEFLLANPILFFVLAAWVAGAIGNAMRAKGGPRKPAGEAARRTSPPPVPGNLPPRIPDRPQPIRRASVDAQPVSRPAPKTGPRAPDEIAAEMRRILGLDVEVMPVEPQRAEPIRREPQRLAVEPERPPTPVAPTVKARQLELHERSHVGEELAGRKRASSVGRHDKPWGTLGGRLREEAPREVTVVRRLVDLTDLKRSILAAEILGPPVCLRGESEMRVF